MPADFSDVFTVRVLPRSGSQRELRLADSRLVRKKPNSRDSRCIRYSVTGVPDLSQPYIVSCVSKHVSWNGYIGQKANEFGECSFVPSAEGGRGNTYSNFTPTLRPNLAIEIKTNVN